jgi:hypothetical protein
MGEFLKSVFGTQSDADAVNPSVEQGLATRQERVVNLRTIEPGNASLALQGIDFPAYTQPLIPFIADLIAIYAAGNIINTDYVVQQLTQGIDVYDEMMDKDPHVFACADTLLGAAASLPYTVTAAVTDKPDLQDRYDEHAAFIEQCFRGFNFLELKKDIFHGALKGFSVVQPILKARKFRGKKKLMPIKHVRYPERMFAVSLSREIKVLSRRNPTTGVPLPVRGLFLTHFRGSQPYGDALLKHAYSAYWFKAIYTKLSMLYAERWGSPPIIGYHTTDEMKLSVLEMLERLRSESVASLPTGQDDLKVLEPSNGMDFIPYFQFFNDEISKVFASGTLVFDHAGGKGNKAATGEHEDRFDQRIWECAISAEYVVNDQLIRELIDLNYGVQEEYPLYETGAEDAEDPQAFIQVLNTLFTAGIPIELSKQQIYDVTKLIRPLSPEDSIMPPPTRPMIAGAPIANFQEAASSSATTNYRSTNRRASNLFDDGSTRSQRKRKRDLLQRLEVMQKN